MSRVSMRWRLRLGRLYGCAGRAALGAMATWTLVAQGTVHFNNFVPEAGIDAPVFDVDGVTRLAGTNWAAQLYGGPSLGSLVPIGGPVPFGEGAQAGYFDSNADPLRTFGFADLGGRVWAQVRVFDRRDGPTYQEAVGLGGNAGVSPVLNLVTGGEGGAAAAPTPLNGLKSFALLQAPRVVSPPKDALREADQAVEFTLEYTGSEPAFQWQFNGTNLIGATNATLALTSLGCRMEGEYRVVVCNALNCVTSSPATLTVTPPSRAPTTGGTVNFNNRVIAAGIDAPFFFEGFRLAGPVWLGQLYAGSTANQLAPAGVPVPFRTGAAAGYINGGTVYVPSVPPGGRACVQVRAWQRTDGCSFEEAWQGPVRRVLKSSLTFIVLGGAPDHAEPADLIGLVSSQAGTTLHEEPRLQDQSAVSGATVTFRLVLASGWEGHGEWQTDALTGFWHTIPGATGWTLVLTNVTTRSAGHYRLLWSRPSPYGTLVFPARLRVLDRPSLAPSPAILPEGRVRLRLEGPRFFEHVIEVSHDLRYWAELHRVLLTNDWVEIDDPLAGQGSSWFYRARVEP